ncbi:MAG: GspH/FimT family pseudopilin [Cyanobacteriota bacterium]|nr:GspH/FimT family pseudopilin [Cyanobacteriota bacterium]
MTPMHHPASRLRSRGFSLPELLIGVALIGILSGVAIATGQAQWEREQINKIAIELSGWLESARRAALRGDTDGDGSVNGCSVTINTGSLSDGSNLATATCLTSQPLRIDNLGSRISVTVASDANPILFSPRGTRSGGAATITLTLNPSGKQRCVSISGLLAMISPGQVNAGSCMANQRF